MNPETALNQIAHLMANLPPDAGDRYTIAYYARKCRLYRRGEHPPGSLVLLLFTRKTAAEGLTTREWNQLALTLSHVIDKGDKP